VRPLAPTSAATCPQCGTHLSASLGDGLCPHCLFGLALSSEESRSSVDAEAPTTDLPPGTLAPGAILGERYRIRKLLGRGGMGEVWRAYDLKLRVDVALKSLHVQWLSNQRMLESLRQEVRSARQVISPNVCRVFDLIELDGSELVTMEYVDGTTLLTVLSERGPLELEEARGIASQLLAGLESIHDAGLIHRDLKPENIMLTRAGRVVIMDFGIAKGVAEGQTGTVAGTPAYMAPEQLHGGGGDARSDLYSVGVVLAEMVAPGGLPAFPAREAVWEGVHHEPPQIAETPWADVIRKAVARNPEQRWPSASALARALEEVTLRVAGAETLQPYPGLSSFTAKDAEYFFGREYEIEAVWKKLRHAHLLALIGPSGAGKSSFLRAGLLPAMQPGWSAVVSTPGDRPFLALAQALADALAGDSRVVHELLQFDDPDVAVTLVERWRKRHEQAVVVVDQFEELFTLSPPEIQQRFAELLGRIALEADARVVVSMRDDFLFQIHAHESLSPVLAELTLLAQPTGAALRRAVVQPALKCGYRFEDDALVDDMLREVEGERGALPMLAFAAAQLWAQRDREQGLLTREAYEQIGGVEGALAQHAEATLEQIGRDRAPIVRELFRNLVTAQGTRAVRERDELLSVFAAGEERRAAAAVLDALIDARLLTSYDTPAEEEQHQERHRIEIVHESLLSNWPRLVRWQTQDTEGAQLRDELRQAARMWEQHSRSEDLLWTGTAFQELQIWRERYSGGLTDQENAFVAAMTAKATRRKRQRRMAVAAVLTAALAVAGVTGVLWKRSEVARRQAVGEAHRAEASKLLALAQLRREKDPTEALALATASLEEADSEEARIFALRLLQEGPFAIESAAEERGISHPTFSPDGKRIATALFHKIRVWSEEGGPPLERTTSGGAQGTAWVSNGILAVSHTPVPAVDLWRIPEFELLRTIELGADEDSKYYWWVRSGRLLADFEKKDSRTGRLWEHVRSWAFSGGEPVELESVDVEAAPPSSEQRTIGIDSRGTGYFALIANRIFHHALPPVAGGKGRLVAEHANRLEKVWFDSDRDHAWTKDAETGELLLWDLSGKSHEPIRRIERPARLEKGLFYFPDARGRWIVHEQPAGVQLWDAERWSLARPIVLRRSGAETGIVQFHPEGRWLQGSTHAGTRLTLWPLASSHPTIVDGYSGTSRPITFTPDGRWLATVWSDGTLRLWPLPGDGNHEARELPVPRRENLGSLQRLNMRWNDIRFDPKGRFVFLVHEADLAPALVPLDGSAPTFTKLGAFGEANPLFAGGAVSPSGRRVATAFQLGWQSQTSEQNLRILDLESGEVRRLELPALLPDRGKLVAGVWDLTFADESTLFTAGAGGVYRWNLDKETSELVYEGSSKGAGTFAAFAPSVRHALVLDPAKGDDELGPVRWLDLETGEARELAALGHISMRAAPWPGPRNGFAASDTVAAVGDREGFIHVAAVDGGPAHLLIGHDGPVVFLAISPDGKWIASTGEDNTLRLWPMPDLTKTPLHLLPHDELIAKLESITNLRAVRDPEAEGGWAIELDRFPGWKEVPTW